jgi:hypothetical protein
MFGKPECRKRKFQSPLDEEFVSIKRRKIDNFKYEENQFIANLNLNFFPEQISSKK